MRQKLKTLKIAKVFELPHQFITKRCNILAKQGGGKSYTAGVICEEIDQFINEFREVDTARLIIIDPNRVYYGLREKYPFHIIGGTYGDIQLNLDKPRKTAQMVHKYNLCVILDLKDEKRSAMQQFVADFLDELYFLSRNIPTHIMIDEADIFAPQSKFGSPEAQASFMAVDSIVRRARSDGMGCTLISQRPQVIDKSVLGQADINIFLNIIEEPALKKVRELLSSTGANKQSIKKYIERITRFEQGEALIVSPSWLKQEPIEIKIRERFSHHGGKTREFGEIKKEPMLMKLKSDELNTYMMQEHAEHVKLEDPGEIKNKWSEAVISNEPVRGLEEVKPINLQPIGWGIVTVILIVAAKLFGLF